MTPDTKRLFLRFFFLSTDIRNDVSYHLRPVFKCLTSSGNCLIGCGNYFIRFKLFPCSKYRCIALDGAVWFYGNETAFGAKTLFLVFDNFHMFRVYFRHYHRNIRCPAVCAVIGNNRCLCLSIIFLDLFDLFFGHIYCGEYEIDFCCYFLYLIDIHDNDVFHCLRHWSIHFPTVTNRLFIGFSGTSRTCCNGCHLKPWVIL